MRNPNLKKYIYYGLTAVAVVAVSLLLTFGLMRIDGVGRAMDRLLDILAPTIIGAVLAYLLAPMYNRCVAFCEPRFTKAMKSEKRGLGAARVIATLISIVATLVVVFGLISILIPQLIESVKGVVMSFSTNAENFSKWLQDVLANNPEVRQQVLLIYNSVLENIEEWMVKENIQKWLTTDVMPNVQSVLTGVSSGLYYVLIAVKNCVIGLIVAVYLLNIKHTLTAQAKKILYGCFKVKIANKILEEVRFINKMFGGFIVGKLLDSLIIGIMCFVGVRWLKMPYTLLISVIIGVTNVIPFFGPFIGAVPCAILILLVSPIKCIYFLLFILALQQFDGNILGPKILGDSTGVSSFWVLFSILLFGGLFGFIGMIIAVPTFAVIYDLISQIITASLNKKSLSDKTEDYVELNHINEENNTYIK